MKTLKLVVLCSDGPSDAALVQALAQRWPLAAVVVEPYGAQIRRLRLRGRWRPWAWAHYHRARRAISGSSQVRAEFFRGATMPASPSPLRVADINSPAVVDLLEQNRPDVTIVRGTSILGGPVLTAAGANVINLHGGVLPHYRGNHCVFFAWLHRRWDCIGATLHFVDRGVDSGDVIEVVRPKLTKPPEETSAEVLYCLSVRAAIARLVQRLASYEAGQPLPREPQGPAQGRVYRTRDRRPGHELLAIARALREGPRAADGNDWLRYFIP